jgi:hypothetical protein
MPKPYPVARPSWRTERGSYLTVSDFKRTRPRIGGPEGQAIDRKSISMRATNLISLFVSLLTLFLNDDRAALATGLKKWLGGAVSRADQTQADYSFLWNQCRLVDLGNWKEPIEGQYFTQWVLAMVTYCAGSDPAGGKIGLPYKQLFWCQK